tara:strand:+ start:503 stop:1516 length:1014 start_codon:yes stop_codon:yes gene_type:complete
MAHEVESMAYAGQVPWHGLGYEVGDDLTPEQMMTVAELNWTVSKRPAYTIDEPTWNEGVNLLSCPDDHFVVRDSDKKILSHCGNDYVPFQNKDVMSFFKKFVANSTMKMHTAGSLKDGKEIWGLAKLDASFTLAGGDRVEGYLLIHSPHVSGKALTIKFTPVRVVCNNTLTYAINKTSDRGVFRILHLQMFDDEIKRAAEEALGISEEAIDVYKEQAEFLSSKRYTNTNFQHYIAELFQPQLLIERAKENIRRDVPMDDEFKQTALALYEMVDTQPGAQLASSKGTWWGAFNVITFYFDHHRREAMQGGRLHSAWFGNGANTKVKALNKAIDYAKAA